MRTFQALLVALLLATPLARGDEGSGQAPPTTVPPSAPAPTTPQQITEVKGSVPPGLVGRWLVVGWVGLPESRTQTTTAVWEIAGSGDTLTLTERWVELPEAQQKAMTSAIQATQPWRPTPEDVAAVQAAWDTLPARDPRLATVKNELVGRGSFKAAGLGDDERSQTLWVVQQTQAFLPSAQPTIKQANVFSADKAVDGGWAGAYQTTILAVAPFPIPINLKGTFQAYRLGDEAAAPGFWDRVFGMFSGCGRR